MLEQAPQKIRPAIRPRVAPTTLRAAAAAGRAALASGDKVKPELRRGEGSEASGEDAAAKARAASIMQKHRWGGGAIFKFPACVRMIAPVYLGIELCVVMGFLVLTYPSGRSR